MLHRLFTEHPASVNETYFEHMAAAGWIFGKMTLGAMACLVHAIFPFLFVKTGSRIITDLHDRMVINRVRNQAPAAPTASAKDAVSA